MKKITVIIILFFITSSAFPQMGKVRGAFSNFEAGKMSKAKELIDAATEHPKSKDDPLTWLYRGQIYAGIAQNFTKELTLDKDAVEKSLEAFKKCIELDSKNEYKDQIRQGLLNLASVKYNDAVAEYNAKNYAAAGAFFEESFNISNTEDFQDTNTVYNIAVSYNLAGEKDKSIPWYAKLLELEYFKPGVFSEYANLLIEKDEIETATKVLEQGREMYPEEYSLLIAESNLFLKTEQPEKAIVTLEKVRESDSENFSINLAIATMYNVLCADTTKTEDVRLNAYEKALATYKKAIELDPDPSSSDVVFNLGAMIFNMGVYYIEIANNLPFGDDNYDAIKAKGEKFLVESLPYLEKANVLKPNNLGTLNSLKEIYLRTKDMEKFKAVNDQIKALQ